MKLLSELPNDVLAQIFAESRRSFLVIALWKCGDSKLNFKLAHSIDFIDLKDTRLASTSRYPKMLSRLTNLRYLSIDRFKFPLMDSASNLLRELMQLSSRKLATLRLLCEEVDTFFGNNSLLASRIPTDAEDLPHIDRPPPSSDELTGETSILRPKPLSCDLSTQFPALTTLHLQTHVPSLVSSRLNGNQASKMPLLPPNLISLATPCFEINPGMDPLFTNLPSSLEIWDVCLFCNAAQNATNESFPDIASSLQAIFRSPPPNLSTIALILLKELPTLRDVEFLPKSLIKSQIVWPADTFHPSCFPTLPPLLSELRINALHGGDFTPAHLMQMPTQLYELTLTAPGLFNAQFINNLPRTLSILRIFSSCRADDLLSRHSGRLPHWPPTLSTLCLDDCTLNSEHLKQLPACITDLTCDWDDAILLVPSNLTSLNCSVICYSIIINQAPSATSLATLKLVGLESFHDENFVIGLPPSLTSLSVAFDPNVPIQSLSEYFMMPSHLTSLAIPSWSILKLHLIPKTITSLSIRETTDLDLCSIQDELDYFGVLPSGLVELNMSCDSLSQVRFSKHSCSTLPHLHTLLLYGIGDFHADILKQLPTGLRKIWIRLYEFDKRNVGYINPYWTEMLIDCSTDEQDALLRRHWPPQVTKRGQVGFINESVQAALKRARQYPDPRVSLPS